MKSLIYLINGLTDKNKLIEAFHHNLLALEFYHLSGNEHRYGQMLTNIGNVLNDLGRYEETEQYYLRAVELIQQIDVKSYTGIHVTNVAEINFLMKKYDRSALFLDQALEINEESENKGYLYRNHYFYAKVDSARGQFQSAYEHYLRFADYFFEVHDQEKEERYSELQTRYETEQKDKQIAYLAQESEIQPLQLQVSRNQLAFAIMFIIVVLGITGFVYRSYYLKKLSNTKLDAIKGEFISYELDLDSILLDIAKAIP